MADTTPEAAQDAVEEPAPATEGPEPVAEATATESEPAAEATEVAADVPAADVPAADVPAEPAVEAPLEAPVERPAAAAEPTPTPPRYATGPAAATGRRKEAVARVRLVAGSGQWNINGRTLEQYFPNKVHQQLIKEPFKQLDVGDHYDVIARVHGGGVSGQAGALRLGLARALTEADGESRPTLKKAGFLTRDARVKERKKYGLKKARKAPQYSKR